MKRIHHPWVSRVGISFGLGMLGLGMLVGASCNVESVFTCLTDEECVAEGGEGGVCEANNLCTFPDMACASGKRWHGRAAELAGKCYEPADIGGTDSVAGTAEDSGSGGTTGSSTSGPGDTTLPADSSSSGEPPPMTDTSAGDSSSGGTPLGCDEQFGTVEGYELCEETPDSCSFNVVLNQSSCDDLCPMFGAICITTFNNNAGDCASIDIEAPCSEIANDQICVCSR